MSSVPAVGARAERAHRELADLRAAERARMLAPAPRSNAHARLRERLRDQFVGRPLGEKVRFLRLLATFVACKAAKRLTPAAPPAATVAPETRPGPRIAVLVPGAIGDLVSGAVFLDALARTAGSVVDVFYKSPGTARTVYRNAPWLGTIHPADTLPALEPRYHLVAEVMDIVWYRRADRSTLARLCPALVPCLDRHDALRAEFGPLVERYPLTLNALTLEMMRRDIDRIGSQFFFGGFDVPVAYGASIDPGPDAATIRARLDLAGRTYVTVHDGIDNEFVFADGASPKQWTLEHWAACIAAIRRLRPDVLVVQVGAKRSRPIPGVDRCFIGQTSLDEAFAVLAGSALHVDGDSGLVRAAWALGVRSIALFGPTPGKFLTLGDNVRVESSGCGNCYWLRIDWMMRCPRGLPTPECMASIAPEDVVSRVVDALASGLPRAA